jgi:hypothetical protein
MHTPPRASATDYDEDFHVQAILDEQTDARGNRMYLVKWLGYPDEENTWESRSDLLVDGHKDAVTQHERKTKGKKPEPASPTFPPLPPSRATEAAAHPHGGGGSASRSRSKTPTPKPLPAAKSASPSPSGRQSRIRQQQQPKSRARTTGSSRMVLQLRRPFVFTLAMLSLFALTATGSVAASLGEDVQPLAQVALHTLPFIFCLVTLMARSDGDKFSSYAAAALVWLTCHVLFLRLSALKEYSSPSVLSGVWVSLVCWALATAGTQLLDGPPRLWLVGLCALATYGALASAPQHHASSLEAAGVVMTATLAFGVALARLLVRPSVPQVTNCLGVVCTWLVVLHFVGVLPETHKLLLPWWLAEDVARWICALSLTVSPLARQGL